MDGSVSRIPDRRIDAMHTLYRDAQAPKGPRSPFLMGKIWKNMETSPF
jgi:hypothetical protein